MKKKQKSAISPASAKLDSAVYIKAVSPKGKTISDTVGLILTKEQAKDLAAKLLAVAHAQNAMGSIIVTGHKKNSRVTIIRKIR